MKIDDLMYFRKGGAENLKFFERLGGKPTFQGLTVLDVGCGHGRLCVDVATEGAKKVVGIDLDEERINFAKANILKNYIHLKNVVNFYCKEIGELESDHFDIILCKDTFEHILNVDVVLLEMKRTLKKGGNIYIGFGPLYNSYFGDHRRTKALIPWGHLIFPETFLIKRANKHRQDKIENIQELGLNKLSLAEYKKLIFSSGLRVLFLGVNVSNHPMLKFFNILRKIRFLEEYFSYNLYCILEKN